jgi:hypothetical protein
MRSTPRLLSAVAALALSAALPAAASAEVVPPVAPVPAPAPAVVVPPPAAGSMKLALVHVGGSPPFALIGGHISVRGTVTPYVAGQTVKASIYREGRKVAVQFVNVLPGPGGSGTFSLKFASASSGAVDIRAAHYANAQQGAFSARAPLVRFVSPNLGYGASGQSVRLLQSELNVLHYVVPLSGVFDEGTGRALIAYRKVTGLNRVPYAGAQVFGLLLRRDGAFHVRYPRDGRHVEGDLTRQVLAEIEPGGKVRAIYTMSSGKPSTPTVIGHFQVYMKTPGVNGEGMVDSNYFISGYAIHGYPEVPTWAASHGCLRMPIPDAPAIYSWIHEGTTVDVYNENGGGTFDVRANVGP